MDQSAFILGMIERFGPMLPAQRDRIIRGDAPLLIGAELEAASRQAGAHLDLARSSTLESLLMLIGRDGEVKLDRAWLMVEFPELDGPQGRAVTETRNGAAAGSYPTLWASLSSDRPARCGPRGAGWAVDQPEVEGGS